MNKHVNIIAAFLTFCMFAAASACRYNSNMLVVTDPAAASQQAYSYNYPTQIPDTTVYVPYSTTVPLQTDVTVGTQTTEATTSAFVPTTNSPAPSVTQPSSSVPPVTEADISTWNTEKIVQYLSDAVNKTKAFTGNVTVDRTEDIGVTIETISPNLPGLKPLANSLITQFTKPVNDVIPFSGGIGVSDGEEIPFLLPKRQAFTLTAAGVKQASAAKNGNNIVIDITLVQESSSMSNPPLYNSQALGYLDISKADLSSITINRLDFVYQGSTIHAVIRPDGYVEAADYHIPLHISADGKAIGINASFEGSAYQTEKWVSHW